MGWGHLAGIGSVVRAGLWAARGQSRGAQPANFCLAGRAVLVWASACGDDLRYEPAGWLSGFFFPRSAPGARHSLASLGDFDLLPACDHEDDAALLLSLLLACWSDGGECERERAVGVHKHVYVWSNSVCTEYT